MMNENLLSPLMLMHHTEFIKTSNLNQQLPQHLDSGAVVAASHKQKIVTKSAERCGLLTVTNQIQRATVLLDVEIIVSSC
jgi:hypothetical protein